MMWRFCSVRLYSVCAPTVHHSYLSSIHHESKFWGNLIWLFSSSWSHVHRRVINKQQQGHEELLISLDIRRRMDLLHHLTQLLIVAPKHLWDSSVHHSCPLIFMQSAWSSAHLSLSTLFLFWKRGSSAASTKNLLMELLLTASQLVILMKVPDAESDSWSSSVLPENCENLLIAIWTVSWSPASSHFFRTAEHLVYPVSAQTCYTTVCVCVCVCLGASIRSQFLLKIL